MLARAKSPPIVAGCARACARAGTARAQREVPARGFAVRGVEAFLFTGCTDTSFCPPRASVPNLRCCTATGTSRPRSGWQPCAQGEADGLGESDAARRRRAWGSWCGADELQGGGAARRAPESAHGRCFFRHWSNMCVRERVCYTRTHKNVCTHKHVYTRAHTLTCVCM